MIREVPRLHRKQWEYAYILSALESAELLAPGRRGLGFGVGREPLVAAIASRGCEVLATNLPDDAPEAAGWRATGQHGPGLSALNERGICAADEFARLVSYEPRDMRDLAGVGRGFDFLWSSCALEHLGSLEAGARFVVDSLGALRPGGTAVHTTEYNASSNERTVREGPVVLYRRRDLEALAAGLRRAGHAIELVFDTGDAPADRHVDIRPYREDLHLKVLYGSFATTSFGLLIRKAGG